MVKLSKVFRSTVERLLLEKRARNQFQRMAELVEPLQLGKVTQATSGC